MASQPDNGIRNMVIDNSIDFDQLVFLHNDFHDARDGLNYGDGNEPLNTPDFQISNPFVPSTFQGSVDPCNGPSTTDSQELPSIVFDSELSVSSEAADEEIIALILDVEVNGIGTDNNLHQPTNNLLPQQTVAEIANELLNAANEISDSVDLQAVVAAMRRYPNAAIRMQTQPVASHRFRYRTDGIRYLEQSRKNPMAVKLPILDGCLIQQYQSFWVQLTLVTTRHNPKGKVFLHQHEMIYNAVNVQQNGLGSFRIQLTDKNIRERRITFRHLSIIKTTRNSYRFELIPFDPLIVNDHVDYFTIPNEDQMPKIKKAKQCDRLYHTNNYQIVCQLMIKQKDQWYITDLYCETRVITDN